MRILVIDDEARLAENIRRGLTEHGYVVDVAHTGVDGLHLALEGSYDLLILDVMLPGIDGLGVLQVLRRSKSTSVLMLSAKDRTEDRVKGLQAGADGYLGKPFAFSELFARVEAMLRRTGGERAPQAAMLRIFDLEVDPLSRRATRSGMRLDLTAKEFSLLTLLIRRSGDVLSRAVLAEEIWETALDRDSNVIEVSIRRLRSKLDDPYERKLLHTVRGMGYVLEDRGS